MRLHRDDEADASEPDEGWVTATEHPEDQTALARTLRRWSVTRHWRGVEAKSANDAIAATMHTMPEETRAAHGDMAMVYMTRTELEAAATACGAMVSQAEANLQIAQSEQIRSVMRHQLTLMNSLRTAFAEARYTLMTPEQVQLEYEELEAARAAGIIPPA